MVSGLMGSLHQDPELWVRLLMALMGQVHGASLLEFPSYKALAGNLGTVEARGQPWLFCFFVFI